MAEMRQLVQVVCHACQLSLIHICKQEGSSDYQIEESKKMMTRIDVILTDPDLLAKIARDMVEHYAKRIEEGSTAVSYTHLISALMLVCECP